MIIGDNMLEYEIPFVCLIFTTLISIIYFNKQKIELEENCYYKNVLIFTLLVNITNLISHYGASVFLVNTLDSWYTEVFAIINKIVLHNPDIPTSKKYLRVAWVGGVSNIIIHWLENGMQEPISEIAEFCYKNLSV